MSDLNEDKLFKELLSASRKEIPFPDFEDDVMTKIEKLEAGKVLIREGYRRGIAFSWFFFVTGIALGILLTSWIPQIEVPLPGVDSGYFLLLFQVGLVLFVLLHFENLISLTRKRRLVPWIK